MKKTTTSIKIAEEIATRIGKGQLHPGQRLIETELAQEFETSRAPIREALLMLERDRLVQRIPHQGVVVRSFTRQEIYDLYDVIYRLEEIAMVKAAVKVEEEDVRKLDEIIEKQRIAAESGNIQEYYDLNEEFHNEIFDICGNRVLSEMYSSLRLGARPFRMLSMKQQGNLNSSLEEHKKQVDSLRNKDVAAGLRGIKEQEVRSLKSLDLLFPE